MSKRPPSSPSAPPLFSKGGFTGAVSNVVRRDRRFDIRDNSELLAERQMRAAAAADRDIILLASVRMDGWEKEKEQRVKVAFDRIVDHGWFDNQEGQLKAVELGHINAVREHYAMRRDKIKTPTILAPETIQKYKKSLDAHGVRPQANYMPAMQWVDNVNALDDLKRQDVDLESSFMGLMRRKAEAAKKKRQQQQQQQQQQQPDQ